MKKTFVRITPEALAARLGLPREARVSHVTYTPERDTYTISVEGVGWETAELSHVKEAEPAYSYQITNWNFPE